MPYKTNKKQRLQNRTWKKNNKDKVNEIARNYRKRNIEKHRAYNREYSKQYRKKFPERISAYNKKYRIKYEKEHFEELKEYHKNYRIKNAKKLKQTYANYRKNNQDKIKICKIKFNYNVTQEEATNLYKRSFGICNICKMSETSKGNNGKISLLSIDHDHKTGKVRGVVCRNCNHGLGDFKESIKNLKSAIKYLQRT